MSQSKSSKQSKSAKRSSKDSASATIHAVADNCGCNYRRARRVARSIDLGVGKGARYDSLNKRQVAKLEKALNA